MVLCGPGSSAATFDDLVSGDLEVAQLKLTYLGVQNHPIPTIVVTVNGRRIDWQAFAPWRGQEHGNDRMFEEYQGDNPSFSVSSEEMRTAVLGLSRIHREIDAADATPFLSCAVTVRNGTARGAEVRLSNRAARESFVLVRSAFRADPKDIQLLEARANAHAMQTLQWWGCALGLLSSDIPARDVTDKVRVAAGGLRWNESLERFESTATLTNISADVIKAPIALVVIPSVPNVSLMNAHGTTCVTRPTGLSFVNIPMAAAVFERGGSLEQVLVFDHGEGEPIQFSTKVLAGPGER